MLLINYEIKVGEKNQWIKIKPFFQAISILLPQDLGGWFFYYKMKAFATFIVMKSFHLK